MRINIYEEELTDETQLVMKDVPQENGRKVTFYGIRLYLKSPQEILDHSTPEDDDRNAITLWVRETGQAGLRDTLLDMAHLTLTKGGGE